MPDSPHTPGHDLDHALERELRDLGTRIEHPPTPDLFGPVLGRLQEEGAPAPGRGGFWSRLPHSRWAVAAALALLFLVPVLSPAVREGVGGVFAGGGAAGGASPGGAAGGGGAAGEMEESPSSAASDAEGDLPSSALPESAAAGQETPTSGASGDESSFDRKVIKTAELGLRAKDVRESAAEAQRIAAGFGGSVLSSEVERDSGSVSAELALSVPSPEFEATLDELRGLGVEVTKDSVRGEDVTEEYVDLESRERNLLAAEEALIRLYEKSESVNDTLRVQRELTAVRGEIEQVQGRMKYLEDRTASSRIDLTIRRAEDAAAPGTGWAPGDVASRAWNASLGMLQAVATAIISVVVFSWWLVPALVVGFAWWRRNRGSETTLSDS